MWAALDCPSGWAHITGGNTAVLGRMTARIVEPVRVDERYVVVGTTTDRDGRKRFANSALYAVSGDLVASAKTTWITVNA